MNYRTFLLMSLFTLNSNQINVMDIKLKILGCALQNHFDEEENEELIEYFIKDPIFTQSIVDMVEFDTLSKIAQEVRLCQAAYKISLLSNELQCLQEQSKNDTQNLILKLPKPKRSLDDQQNICHASKKIAK